MQLDLAIFIPGQQAGLNEILHAQVVGYRKANGRRVDQYKQEIKWPLMALVKALCARDQVQQLPAPTAITFLHLERDQRRDPDNLTSGPQKSILDALVELKLLPRKDGWKGISDLRHHWHIDDAIPRRVGIVLVAAPRVLEKAEALELVPRVCSKHGNARAETPRPHRAPRRAGKGPGAGSALERLIRDAQRRAGTG